MKKLSRYAKVLGLVAAGAIAGCTTSGSSLLSSKSTDEQTAQAAGAPSPDAVAAASGEATGPMGRVKSMFTSTKTTNRTPALPSVTDNDKPPKATPDFHLAMAKQMESTGNLPAAEDQYQRALALDSDNLPALINLAHLCDRQKRMPEAEALYVKATKLHPTEAAAFNDLGLCYARQRKLPQSKAALAEAVRLDEGRTLYRNNLATVLVEINQPQEAFEQLRAVHEESVAHYNLGYLLANHGDNRLARQHFEHALAIDPKLTAAQTWLDGLEQQAHSMAAVPSAGDAATQASAETNLSLSGASGSPEPLSEVPGSGPQLHPGLHKLPPVDDSAGHPLSRF